MLLYKRVSLCLLLSSLVLGNPRHLNIKKLLHEIHQRNTLLLNEPQQQKNEFPAEGLSFPDSTYSASPLIQRSNSLREDAKIIFFEDRFHPHLRVPFPTGDGHVIVPETDREETLSVNKNKITNFNSKEAFLNANELLTQGRYKKEKRNSNINPLGRVTIQTILSRLGTPEYRLPLLTSSDDHSTMDKGDSSSTVTHLGTPSFRLPEYLIQSDKVEVVGNQQLLTKTDRQKSSKYQSQDSWRLSERDNSFKSEASPKIHEYLGSPSFRLSDHLYSADTLQPISKDNLQVAFESTGSPPFRLPVHFYVPEEVLSRTIDNLRGPIKPVDPKPLPLPLYLNKDEIPDIRYDESPAIIEDLGTPLFRLPNFISKHSEEKYLKNLQFPHSPFESLGAQSHPSLNGPVHHAFTDSLKRNELPPVLEQIGTPLFRTPTPVARPLLLTDEEFIIGTKYSRLYTFCKCRFYPLILLIVHGSTRYFLVSYEALFYDGLTL